MVADNIDRRAKAWVVLLDKGDPPPALKAELDLWLAADDRHLGAFVRAQAAWRMLDKARVLPIESQTDGRRTALRWLFGGGLAACLATGAGLGLLAYRQTEIYSTRKGEIRRIRLDDGSVAVLDTATRIETAFGLRRRDVEVVQGCAWFEVAHNRSRPFVVQAGDAQLKAVGTAFSVRKTELGADVMVTQGVVEARPAAQAPPRRLPAGTSAAIASQTIKVSNIPADKLNRELSWREGRIALDGGPLRDAVARFNAYNAQKLVLANPKLGDASVVGWFRLDDPQSFARAAAIALSAEVTVETDQIILTEKSEPAPELQKN